MRVLSALFVVTLLWVTPVTALEHLQGLDPPGSQFGHSVSDAGDFNGDGRPDLIVGAPMDNSPGSQNGRAFIFLGHDGGYDLMPELILNDGTGTTRRFGWSVAGIGDVNGDNYDDVAVGAPYDDGGGEDAGAVFIYFGGANPNDSWDLRLRGETGMDRFGYWVSRGGDLNDDGDPDWLVGAPYALNNESGAVYLYLGDSGTPSSNFALRLDGEINGDLFGWSVSEVENFAGDDVAAILVGAPGYGADAGRAYLFYGGKNNTLPDATVDVRFENAVGGQEFGYAVSTAGFFNGDSLTDLAIGAPGAFSDRGYVRVYYGDSSLVGSPPTPTNDFEIGGPDANNRFGAALDLAGDFSGTSRDDLLVGAPERDSVAMDAGAAYLFEGGRSYTNVSLADVFGPENASGSAVASDQFGFAVSTLGDDLDGDGNVDFVVGTPFGNGREAAVRGTVALVGSGVGIVPVAEIPMVALPMGGGHLELRFSGLALEAQSLSLWTVAPQARLLAATDVSDVPRFTRDYDAMAVVLESAAVAGVASVELRFEWGEESFSQQYELPQRMLDVVLHPASPNPFNPSTRLSFTLPRTTAYELVVYDLRGRSVRHLAKGQDGPGELEFLFNGADDRGMPLASGSYRAVLRADGQERSTTMVLVK